ncbi:MAG: ATP-binding domain-containing protein, partial [Bdellovibrionales bacterium]|nr:ATP-binding domain-containing protein [Bdellovibrionales bacterium]
RRFKNCQVVRLEINYRSTPSILNMANALIVKNQERHTKTLIPHRPEDKGSLPELFIFEDEETECERIIDLIREHIKEGCSLKDISVLFRSNSQGALLEGYLRNERLPYEMTGGPALIDRREVRDVLAYLRAALMPNDICLRRILNVPARGIGDQSVAKIIEYQKEHDLSFHQALKQWPKTQIAERVGQSVDGFFSVLAQMENQLLNPQEAYSTLLPKIFYELGYKQVVLGAYKEKGVGQRKWQLVEILGRILDGFIGRGGASIKTIRDFLDTLELRDTDSSEDSEDKIQLLTFHASKGLEYPVVILMGVDDGLIPHETLGSNVSEERRLFYVGLTRAKRQLILTRCLQRRRYGKMREVSPSRFLMDIPESHFTTYEGGFRPIVESDRKQMIADLFKRIDDKKKDYSSEL